MKSIDIVFPKNNEEEFIKIAKALGTKEIVFVYALKNYQNSSEYCKYNNTEVKGMVIRTAVYVTKEDIKRSKKNLLTILRSDRNIDRWQIENLKPAILYGFEFCERKDFMHHRNSGLNDVLARLMCKNNVAYGFPVAELLTAPTEQQPIILGRMRQNVMIAKKYKVEIIIASFTSNPMLMRNVKDMYSLID